MGKRLFVGNLAWGTTDQDLVDFFGAGTVSAKVIMDRESGRSRGFAFVEAESDADAERIMHTFAGADLQGRELRINEAEERTRSDSRPRSSAGGGGGYSGGGHGGGGRYAPSAAPPEVRHGKGSRRRGRGDHDGDSW
jgi:RNA recognition motif-containing protein